MAVLKAVIPLLFWLSGGALAQGAVPATKVLALDDMSCAQWIRTKSEPALRGPSLDWARGFLSGHNYGQPNKQVSVVSNGTIAVFIDRYCAEKPTSSIDIALMRMSDQYSGRNAPITR